MDITEKEIKTLFQYQMCASLMSEYFSYAAPILKSIEESKKYISRQQKRQALKEYDKAILIHKKWLLSTANILENNYNKEAETFIDRATEILNKITVTKGK